MDDIEVFNPIHKGIWKRFQERDRIDIRGKRRVYRLSHHMPGFGESKEAPAWIQNDLIHAEHPPNHDRIALFSRREESGCIRSVYVYTASIGTGGLVPDWQAGASASFLYFALEEIGADVVCTRYMVSNHGGELTGAEWEVFCKTMLAIREIMKALKEQEDEG